jgi:hypothetical protein
VALLNIRQTLVPSPSNLPAAHFLLYGFLLLALMSCAPTPPIGSTTGPNLRALTKQAISLGTACDTAAARFAAAPTKEMRREVLARLKELNAALIEAAGYEREARRSNSVDLVDANRAFHETGRAWGGCSLKYNRTLMAIGEVDTARYNYQGLLDRLTGPQFVSERRQIQTALRELER